MIIDLEDYVSMQNDIANKSMEIEQLRADKARLFAELESVKRVANQQASQNAELIQFLKTVPLFSDICCCGTSFEAHAQTDHQYMDAGEYEIAELINKFPSSV